MSHFFKFILLTIFILSKSEIEYGPCIDNKRIIKFEDGSTKTFDCIECQTNKYTTYKDNKLECVDCPQHSYNYGKNIVIDSFYKNIMTRYSPIFDNICSTDDKNLCPKWENYIFSLKVENIKDNIDSKSILKWNQYYVDDGQFIIKYNNFNGGINKYLLIYINKILVYKDDKKDSKIKTKEFEINKGNNEIEIIYIVDKNLSPKVQSDLESFLEIYEIQMTNAEKSSLECQKYDNINILKDSMINNCDYYINKCTENDYCTFRFFTEKSEGSNLKFGTQFISYNKTEGGICNLLIEPPIIEIEAEQCSYGQFRKKENENANIYTCDHCPDNTYNDKIINYGFSCKELYDTTNKELKKIFYIKNFEDQTEYKVDIGINEQDTIGYVEVNYEKFNLREDAIIFNEITNLNRNETKTYKVINPDIRTYKGDENFSFRIPFEKGEYNYHIKGKNMKLKEIKIINGEKGGNYKYTDKLIPEEEVICDPNNYYSPNEKQCTECHYGSFISENSKCTFAEQIISNKFILENSQFIINDLISNTKIITKDKIQYHLFLNPTYPLIYKKNEDETIQIIGNEFDKAKLIRGINDRGIILSFFHTDNNLNYTTYVYIKCKRPDSEEKFELIKEQEEGANKYYYFRIESNITCPYCLEKEIEEIQAGECTKENKMLFNIIPKKTSVCVVKPYENSTSSNIIIKANDEMLLFFNSSNKEDQDLIDSYNITEEIPLFNEKEEDTIVFETQRYKHCEYKEKGEEGDGEGDGSLGAGYIALIAVGSLLVIGIIVVIIWRVKKSHNDSDVSSVDVQELNLRSTKEEL